MLNKKWCVFLTVLGLTILEVGMASASGGGARGSCAGGGATKCRTGGGGCCGNSGQFLRAENGIFGPTWASGNAYWGCGGIDCCSGFGLGLGYGCGYPGWGYAPSAIGYLPERVPYFALFPPVYYGSAEPVPTWNASTRSFWVGNESTQSTAEPPASLSPPRQPLRIINPYYVEAKADKP
jgi:hypothetical protein